jgi:outer membrane biosynthesis protein TonB
LFWRLPPDLWSLLLVQVPLRGRRPEQLRLSALQGTLPLKLIGAAGAVLLLPLLWWADASAGLAWAWSPLSASPRLVVLLVSVPLLALMLWQWQQLIQAVWMLTRPASLVDQTLPLTQAIAAETRLNAGLPLLLLAPLEMDASSESPVSPQPEPAASVSEPTADASEAPLAAGSEQDEAEPEPEPIEAALPEPSVQAEDPVQPEPDPDPSDDDPAVSDAAVVDAGVAVTPEQAAEEHQGTNLNS